MTSVFDVFEGGTPCEASLELRTPARAATKLPGSLLGTRPIVWASIRRLGYLDFDTGGYDWTGESRLGWQDRERDDVEGLGPNFVNVFSLGRSVSQ